MKQVNKNAKKWFQIADDDLLFAKAGLKESGLARNACFLCQQIVEKYLKGFLVQQKIQPKRTHILMDLLRECSIFDKGFLNFEEECDFLDQFYQPARYPNGIPLEFKKELGIKAIQSAEKIIDFIKNKLKIK